MLFSIGLTFYSLLYSGKNNLSSRMRYLRKGSLWARCAFYKSRINGSRRVFLPLFETESEANSPSPVTAGFDLLRVNCNIHSDYTVIHWAGVFDLLFYIQP